MSNFGAVIFSTLWARRFYDYDCSTVRIYFNTFTEANWTEGYSKSYAYESLSFMYESSKTYPPLTVLLRLII